MSAPMDMTRKICWSRAKPQTVIETGGEGRQSGSHHCADELLFRIICEFVTFRTQCIDIVQRRKQELHLQELVSFAQAFLTRSVKRRNINVASFAKQKRMASRNSQKCF